MNKHGIVLRFDEDILVKILELKDRGCVDKKIRDFFLTKGMREFSQGFFVGEVNSVEAILVVQELALKYPWFNPSLKEARLIRILDDNNLIPALNFIVETKNP